MSEAAQPQQPDIVLWMRNATKEYGKGRAKALAVSDVSLEIRRGEVVLVMGPSGSGKTTLISMMGGILRPTSGNVWLLGTETSALQGSDLTRVRRHHVGFVFQTFNLLRSLRAWENVAVALRLAGRSGPEAKRRAMDLIEMVGLGDKQHELPADLTGGEQQRVSIARALANDPSLVLADEPTASLDSQAGRLAVDILCSLSRDKGRSLVIATHDARIRDVADRVLYLEDGRIAKNRPGR